MKQRTKQIAGGLMGLMVGMGLGIGNPFFTFFIGGILVISWFFLLVIGAFFINHHRWKVILQTFVVLSILLVGILVGGNLKSTYNTYASEKLIKTLEVYNTQMGTYPTNLIELIPVYCDYLSTYIGVWGMQPFDYSYSMEENEFILGYSSDDFVLESYVSKTKYWTIDSGI